MSQKNENPPTIKLDAVLAFEIEAYRAESELASQKFRSEAALRSILDSRTWRYTRLFRSFVQMVISPFLKSAGGIKFLRFVSRVLR